jgi:tetratricopeptide (TPR) repeat protein
MLTKITLAMLIIPILYPMASWASLERRQEALQLYQEGLFQETGTGDLNMAQQIFTNLIKDYKDYRDIAAVALYHLGLVHEKLGNHPTAKKYFQNLIRHYSDQEKLVQKAQSKLKRYTAQQAEAEAECPSPSRKTAPKKLQASPVREPISPQPKKPVPRRENGSPTAAGKAGLGINYLGLHARYALKKDLQLEAKVRLRNLETHDFLLGGRISYCFNPKIPNFPLYLYAGCEIDGTFYNSGKTGYMTGGFIGSEISVLKNVGLGADIGYFYGDFKHHSKNSVDTDIIFNGGITFYF